MKVIVNSYSEAISLARYLTSAARYILENPAIDDITQMSLETILCNLRDNISVIEKAILDIDGASLKAYLIKEFFNEKED